MNIGNKKSVRKDRESDERNEKLFQEMKGKEKGKGIKKKEKKIFSFFCCFLFLARLYTYFSVCNIPRDALLFCFFFFSSFPFSYLTTKFHSLLILHLLLLFFIMPLIPSPSSSYFFCPPNISLSTSSHTNVHFHQHFHLPFSTPPLDSSNCISYLIRGWNGKNPFFAFSFTLFLISYHL